MIDEANEQALAGGVEADLVVLEEAYGLGVVCERPRYLSEGLMNRNWRLDTPSGVFALKQISDVPMPIARRNLDAIAALGAQGVPACTAVATDAGRRVVEVEDRGYALFPWVQGAHRHGTQLSHAEAWELGAVLGRVHGALNALGPGLLPDAGERPRAKVADPARAATEAHRFLRLAQAEGDEFGSRVGEFLEQRLVLLEKFADQRPVDEVPLGPFGWTHGDFQHLNVLWEDGRVVGVLDWDRIRVRPFGEELARSSTLLFGHARGELDLDRVGQFTAGYRSVVPLSEDELTDAAERLWWKRMCDYWHLEFHFDRADHSCDHLFFSASRFLDWWASHRDEVREAFAAI